MPLDPIDLEIRWRRLITIMDELDAAVVRTSFSTIVGESRDFAVILVDRLGRSLAQSQLSTPAFTVTLPITCKHFLVQYPADRLEPGDVLITNDPWLASGHLPDLTICTPVFRGSRLVAFMGCTAHISDIGGRVDYFEDRDLFEEGLRILPTLLFRRGEPDAQLFRMIEANVRVPDAVIGDIYAIVGAEREGAARLLEFMDDYDMPSLDGLADEILGRSEAAMRVAIRALPDGSYRYALDVDGYKRPVHVAVDVQIRRDHVTVDFTGSSPEREDTSINCVLNNTFSDVYYPFKCSLLPELPNNEGLTRPFTAKAPEGSIFNTRFPRAVRSRSKTSFHIHAAIYGALARAMSDRVQAGSGSFWSFVAFGTDEDGLSYRVHMLPNGGKGATPLADGLPTIAFPYNGTATPVEILENNAPMLVGCRELLPDSGGAGRYRGGLGQRLRFTPAGRRPVGMFVRPDKMLYPAPGIAGGQPGAPGALLLNGRNAPLGAVTLQPGDVLELRLPGGGGLGRPAQRPKHLIARDVQEGYTSRGARVSSRAARRHPRTGV
jgi:N-methylhydantoinase B/oxoprolinase/acetone carboxylase alpha subunit